MKKPAHPGFVLKELYMEPLGLTVTKTAASLGVSRKTLSALINENSGISPVMAMKLAKAFGNTPKVWMDMQTAFDLWSFRNSGELSKVKVLHR